MNRWPRLALLMTGLFLILSVIGCEDEITVIVPPQTEENSPPSSFASTPLH